MENVKFTETVITNSGKKGVMTADSDGYFTVIVGALNCYNSAGEYYTAKGALDLFNSSSVFMRRIASGALYSEVGHPKKLPSMSNEAFYNRVVALEDTNICGHFKEVTLDFSFGKRNPQFANPDIIAIVAKVKPAGAKANVLELAFSNPHQNSAFSIRGLTENKVVNGRTERRLFNIVTFDHVTEPGIKAADKYMAPSLESFRAHELNDHTVDMNTLKRVLQYNTGSFANESTRTICNEISASLASTHKRSKLTGW